MIQKAITKYGLAFHLAILAAIPSSLAPFVSEQALGRVVLWLSLFAALWIFFEPSIRPGEHLSLARMRVCASIVRDPIVWFFWVYILLVGIRWLNAGMEMAYDPEKVAWVVSEPALSIFPGSVDGVGFMSFAVSVGGMVLVAGLRHAVGLGARSSFALTGSFFAGLGGLATAVCACVGIEPFVKDAMQGFGIIRAPAIGSLFGIWLLIGIGAGVLAEARNWKRGRIFFIAAIGGNVAGVIFFSPPLVAAAYLLVAILFAIFCLVWLGRVSSKGAVARIFSFILMGALVPTFLIMAFTSPEFKNAKFKFLDPTVAWDAKTSNANSVLSEVSKRLWLADPWRGAGLGAFKLKVPFIVHKEEWDAIPPNVERSVNGYWTILAERGNVMCALFALGLGLMLWAWCSSGAQAFIAIRRNQDADAFPFACSPEVWLPLLFAPLLAVESVFTSVCSLNTLPLAIVTALALAAASFPRRHVIEVSKEDN